MFTSMQTPKVHVEQLPLAVKIEEDMSAAEGSRLKLFVCFIGVFVSYFIYGVLQENITKAKYGEKDERFTYTMALVFIQCIVNALFAKVAIMLERSTREDTTSHKSYAMMAFSYVGAMLASNQALQYVSYPTQVLGKSIKPIPVMILGVIYAHKRYPLRKYAFVLMITLGVALFMFKDKKGVDSDHLVGWGEALLIVSLLLDGMTGAVQERARSENRTQAYPMMINMNLWAVLYLGVALLVTGEGYNFILFSLRFPSVLFQMFTFSIMSAIGQVFIFITVTTFGPLTCSIITTTRKFFTILASVVIFQHPMTSRQWMGTSMVFVGLSLDSVYGKERKNLQKPAQK